MVAGELGSGASRKGPRMKFAAVAMDGARPRVFGLGATEAEAEEAALQRMAEADVELDDNGEVPMIACFPVGDAQAKQIAEAMAERDRQVMPPSAPHLVVSQVWDCPARGGAPCEYNHDEDPAHDRCVHCGDPEERK